MELTYASCVFSPKGDPYTFIVPEGLPVNVGDLVVVEVTGGTYKFPFGVAQIIRVGVPLPTKFTNMKFIHSVIEDLI